MTAHIKIVPMSVLQESGSWSPSDHIPSVHLLDIDKAIARTQKILLNAQTRLAELARLRDAILETDNRTFIGEELRLELRKTLYEPARG